MPAAAIPAATRTVLRVFIFEPLESFDAVVESSVDAASVCRD
jgi:hypothetical protein